MADKQIQIGLLVALSEELAQIQSCLARPSSGTTYIHNGRQYDVFCHPEHEDLTIACGTSSGAGLVNTCLAAQRIISDVRPSLIVMTGIAGSLNKDIHLGDAVLASDVVQYLAEAKAIDRRGRKTFELLLDGHTQSADPRLHETLRRFMDELSQEQVSWQDLRAPFIDNAFLTKRALGQRRSQGQRPNIHLGKIASGDIVCTSESFKQLLAARDRKVLAVEMESAGAAAAATREQIPWLFVRGISDYGDGSKGTTDDESGPGDEDPVGPWRKHAANFAGRILVALLPPIAHALRLGSPDGIASRDRTLQSRELEPPSPSTIARRQVASFQESNEDTIASEIVSYFDSFVSRFLTGEAKAIYVVGITPRLGIQFFSGSRIDINEVDSHGKVLRYLGRIENGVSRWSAGVDQPMEERLQTRFDQVALWLSRVPESMGDGVNNGVAAIDTDGNVTLGSKLYLRRQTRVIDTAAYDHGTKIADMRITLRRDLGLAPKDEAIVISAINTSLSSRLLDRGGSTLAEAMVPTDGE